MDENNRFTFSNVVNVNVRTIIDSYICHKVSPVRFRNGGSNLSPYAAIEICVVCSLQIFILQVLERKDSYDMVNLKHFSTGLFILFVLNSFHTLAHAVEELKVPLKNAQGEQVGM